jgi:NADPH:quinone reductase-like Zn-dependent oxidoreductase
VIAAVNDAEADELVVADVPDPEPGAGQLLIRVRAAGVNRADIADRGGRRRRMTPRTGSGGVDIAGLELAGEVLTVGERVDGWSVGDRVMSRGAGYAEFAVIEASHAMAVPDRLTWEQAGGLPVALTTMHDAIATLGALPAGGTVLVQAATSGIGVVGCKIAALLGASTVFAVSRSAHKLDLLTRHLAPLACEVVPTPFATVAATVADRTGGRGVDVVVDTVGAAALAANVDSAAICGRIVQVGRVGGASAVLDLDELARKRISLIGASFRTRTIGDVAEIVATAIEDVGDHLPEIAPRVERTYPLARARAAQDDLMRNEHVGKLVLVT